MEKTIIYDGGGRAGESSWLNAIAPLLKQNGIDPNLLLAMMNGGFGGFGGGGGTFIWLIFLLALMRGNGFGFGGNGNCDNGAQLANLINNDNGRELLMSAIQGNGNAISQLSSMFNCSVGQIQQSINTIGTLIQNVGNQVGLGFQQTINAIQAGNCSLMSKIADCCCENRLAICQQTNTLTSEINSVAVGQERGFSSLAFETQKQTCALEKTMDENTRAITARLDAMERASLQDKLDAEREKNSTLRTQLNLEHQNAYFTQLVGSAVAPIVSDLEKIKCKMPESVNVPYSPVTAIPNCVAYGAGFYGGPYNGGFWG